MERSEGGQGFDVEGIHLAELHVETEFGGIGPGLVEGLRGKLNGHHLPIGTLAVQGEGHAAAPRPHIEHPDGTMLRLMGDPGHAVQEPTHHLLRLRSGNEHVAGTSDAEAPKLGPPQHALHRLPAEDPVEVMAEAGQFPLVIAAVQCLQQDAAPVVEVGHQAIGDGLPLPRSVEHGQAGFGEPLAKPFPNGPVPVVRGQGSPLPLRVRQCGGRSARPWPDWWRGARCGRHTGGGAC